MAGSSLRISGHCNARNHNERECLKMQKAVWAGALFCCLIQAGSAGGARGDWLTFRDTAVVDVETNDQPLPDIRYITTAPHWTAVYAQQTVIEEGLLVVHPAVGIWISRQGSRNQSIGTDAGWLFYPLDGGVPTSVYFNVGNYKMHLVAWGESIYPPPAL
jgi:hypothetical protein